MSKRYGWALALALGVGGHASAAEFQFNLDGLGLDAFSGQGLTGSFHYSHFTGASSRVVSKTSLIDYAGSAGSILVDDTKAKASIARFSFDAGAATLMVDVEGINSAITGTEATETASFSAYAIPGRASDASVFELDGLTTDLFGGTVRVTNLGPRAIDPDTAGAPSGPARNAGNGQTTAQSGGHPAALAALPRPASLLLSLRVLAC